MVWRRKHRAASLHIVGAEASTTCSLGPGLNSAIFHLYFFPLWQSPSRGAKCKKNTLFLSYNAPAFTSKSCESQKISWECAREFWRISKIIEKDSFFCWKCTILTRSLNCVGFELWELSRNHKGHVSVVKCCQLSWISNLSFFPFWLFCHLREHFYMCSTTPHTHSHVCHLLIYSSTSYWSISSSSFFSFCYYGVCLPYSLYV